MLKRGHVQINKGMSEGIPSPGKNLEKIPECIVKIFSKENLGKISEEISEGVPKEISGRLPLNIIK